VRNDSHGAIVIPHLMVPEMSADVVLRRRGSDSPNVQYFNGPNKPKSIPLSGGRAVIAIVDDEDSVRKAIVRVLRAAGFTARGYPSGEEFLDSWHFDRPDCLVLDLQMPGLSGTEVQRSLKTAGARFPIVIITAHDSPGLREECISAGAIEYLSKPLDFRTLVQAVSRVISPTDQP
jgi:FixJ family two-component response regulator